MGMGKLKSYRQHLCHHQSQLKTDAKTVYMHMKPKFKFKFWFPMLDLFSVLVVTDYDTKAPQFDHAHKNFLSLRIVRFFENVTRLLTLFHLRQIIL